MIVSLACLPRVPILRGAQILGRQRPRDGPCMRAQTSFHRLCNSANGNDST